MIACSTCPFRRQGDTGHLWSDGCAPEITVSGAGAPVSGPHPLSVCVDWDVWQGRGTSFVFGFVAGSSAVTPTGADSLG